MPPHRALQIAEVLQNIICHCENGSNAQNALVCKKWSEISLDILWYELTDVRPFLELFGRLVAEDDGADDSDSDVDVESYKYAETPSLLIWKRFEQVYQNRPRVLKLTNTAEEYEAAFVVIARIRSPGPLLPRLHTLEWCGLSGLGLSEPSVMFMHDKIRSFRLHARDDESAESLESFNSYCDTIACRMPLISELQLLVAPLPERQTTLLTLLQQLPNLSSLVMPSFRDLSALLSGLRALPHIGGLKDLQLIQLHWAPPIYPLSRPLPKIGFQHLQVLELYCLYEFATQLLQSQGRIDLLQEFTITSAKPEPATNIRHLIVAIGSACSRVQELRIFFNSKQTEDLPSEPSTDSMIQMADISPLLDQCQEMMVFNLQSPYPLAVDDDDIEQIARSWPLIEVLWLCDQPRYLLLDRAKRVTLRGLSSFSRHCLKLQILGLYIDATAICVPQASIIPKPRTFGNLYKLELGPSPIDHPARTAYTLAQMLPSPIELTFGSEWSEPLLISPHVESWENKWQAVVDALEVMLEIQGEMRNLQEENQSLQEKLRKVEGLEGEGSTQSR